LEQCSSCNSFLYRGKKFNSKKEAVKGSGGTYLGIQIWRFYIKCTVCARPITFLTDPENSDYKCESGAVRNYELWKDKEGTENMEKEEREEEDKMDGMKRLENRVEDSKREMAELDALDEIKMMNSRHNKMDMGKILDRKRDEEEVLNEEGLSKEDEDLVKGIKFGTHAGDNIAIISRLDDDDDEDGNANNTGSRSNSGGCTNPPTKPEKQKHKIIVKAKRRRQDTGEKNGNDYGSDRNNKKKKEDTPASALSMLGDYGSDSD